MRGSGALYAGSWGSIVGFLGGELVSLAVPGVSSIVLAGARTTALVGLAIGTFYGASHSRRITQSRDQHGYFTLTS